MPATSYKKRSYANKGFQVIPNQKHLAAQQRFIVLQF